MIPPNKNRFPFAVEPRHQKRDIGGLKMMTLTTCEKISLRRSFWHRLKVNPAQRWLAYGLTKQFVLVFAMLFGWAAWMPIHCMAGGGPENVVLVVNADSAASKLIANHYVAGRGIPARNVIYLSGIPDAHWTGAGVFSTKIIRPILEQIAERKLDNHIDYIVYSAGFPTMINVSGELTRLKDAFAAEIPPRTLSENLYTPNISITSATYFANVMLKSDPSYMLLDANHYYRQPAQAILNRPFVGELQKEFERNIRAFDRQPSAEFDAAIVSLEAMAEKNPRQVAVLYWLARFFATKEDVKQSIHWLTQATKMGWNYRRQTESDSAFQKIKDDPDFVALLKRIPLEPFEFAPTRGFKNSYLWGANGLLNNDAEQGSRYYLSTTLAVTRFQGNSEQEALRQLKATMQCDESHPAGTFYFSDTTDVRNTTRKSSYPVAIAALGRLGQKAEILTTSLPEKKDDVLGLSTGTGKFDWKSSGSRFVPGAIGDNLTSYGGHMISTGQTLLTEFLRYGAAGASGTVVEPYAIQAKFPTPMLHVHYARGCSLAESFYQSVAGPFQLLIVGDALCQPFATRPIIIVSGIEPEAKLAGKVQVGFDDSQSAVPIAGLELYVDGVLVLRDRWRANLGFDTTGLSDGYHEIRVVAIADNPIETTGAVVLSILVDNHGLSTALTSSRTEYLESDTITVKAKSNHGQSIVLTHNMRSLAKKNGQDVEFEVPASWLGRGPVKLEAIALDSSGIAVASSPLELEIMGKVAEK